jgi:hypothetical protein
LRDRKQDAVERDIILLKFLFKNKSEVTEEEVEYFKKHPDEIDEVTASINIHKLFLAIGIGLGVLLVVISKTVAHSSFLPVVNELLRAILVDIVFEIGVALIGAGVTAYMLGILLNAQQENAREWRLMIRKRIGMLDGAES